MSYAFSWGEEAITSILMALFTGIPSGMLGIGCYVLRSLALYTLAQRREIPFAWLSWVPVLSCWILGSLSDQYRYVVKGQVKSRRSLLLVLRVLRGLLTTGILAYAVFVAITLLGPMNRSFQYYGISSMLKPLASIGILGMLLAGVSIAATVFRFMALYDVYVSVDPVNAVLFLVLSILVPVVEPFFLFFNRDKDTGMPPRRIVTPPAPEQHDPDEQNDSIPNWDPSRPSP